MSQGDDEAGRADPWRWTFESHVDFDLVLLDGDLWHCHLLQWSPNELLVETERGTCLVPRHAIKFVLVDQPAQELLEQAAAQVPALQEFLEGEADDSPDTQVRDRA